MKNKFRDLLNLECTKGHGSGINFPLLFSFAQDCAIIGWLLYIDELVDKKVSLYEEILEE